MAEGLLWALAPGTVEDLLLALRSLDAGQRRIVGLLALALGLALVGAAGLLGASLTPT